MAVAISVLAVTSKVGKEGCTTLELGVGGGDTSVDYVEEVALVWRLMWETRDRPQVEEL
jgi:hypothetical protein